MEYNVIYNELLLKSNYGFFKLHAEFGLYRSRFTCKYFKKLVRIAERIALALELKGDTQELSADNSEDRGILTKQSI